MLTQVFYSYIIGLDRYQLNFIGFLHAPWVYEQISEIERVVRHLGGGSYLYIDAFFIRPSLLIFLQFGWIYDSHVFFIVN